MVTKKATEDIAGKGKSGRNTSATGSAIKSVAGNITTPTPAKADTNGYKIRAEEWGFPKGDTDSKVVAALSTRLAMTATTYKAFAGGGDALEVTDLMCELRKAGEEVADSTSPDPALSSTTWRCGQASRTVSKASRY